MYFAKDQQPNMMLNEFENDEKNLFKLSTFGFGFKLIGFASILSVTWFITALAGCILGLCLTFYVVSGYVNEESIMQSSLNLYGVFSWGIGGICIFCTFSLLMWGRMIRECKEENTIGIEKILTVYCLVSALTNLIINFAGLLLLVVYEEKHLKDAIESLFQSYTVGHILVLLIFIGGIVFTSKLIHGLRTKQDGHLSDYIIFRYILLGLTLILTIITVSMMTTNTGDWCVPLYGLLALSLGCLIFMLDVGPTIILHSIWKQEIIENPV